MSSFGGSGGSRTRSSTNVIVNIYDLSPANDILYPIGFGLHHSGVEISGIEYSFASGAGIFEATPKDAPGAIFRCEINIGSYDGGSNQLKTILHELRDIFGPDDYNLIRKNCNHFANALCIKLLNTRLPGYVNRLADVGICCSCLLPKKLLENAPVGDTNTSASQSSSSSFLVKTPDGRTVDQSTSIGIKPFQGTGAKLGSSNINNDEQRSLLQRFTIGSQLGTNHPRQDDLTDRREKARKAALARLEQQQQHSNDSDKSH